MRRSSTALALAFAIALAAPITHSAEIGGASAPPATARNPVDQTPPPQINGIEVVDDVIYVASAAGDEILAVDAATGTIAFRSPTNGAAPDDIVEAADGNLYATGIGDGTVVQYCVGDCHATTSTFATLEAGINPIDVSADGTSLFVGQATGGKLWEVPLDGGEPRLVTDALPVINAFEVIGDAVYAPAGGFEPGSVIRIDTESGDISTVADEFPSAFGDTVQLLASTVDSDGEYYALGNITGEIFHVDLDTGKATLAATVPGGPWDNIAFGDSDGNVYLSSFTTPTIVVLHADATVTTITVGDSALLPTEAAG